MTSGAALIVMRHGTTRQRALAILHQGPDKYFVEPGGMTRAEGFSTVASTGPFPTGTPEMYAAGKARAFPNEGGPAIREIEVPEDLANLAYSLGEYRFQPGFGLEELLQAWPTLTKRVV